MGARVIPLTKGYVTIVSSNDFLKVNRYKWYAHISKGTGRKHGQPYARANINGKKVYLHRFLTDPDEDMHVDHKNHQTLDNRRENLEIVSKDENMKRKRPRKSERPLKKIKRSSSKSTHA